MSINALPSPPTSPELRNDDLDEHDLTDDDNDNGNDSTLCVAMCGTCNIELGRDWFCANCHKKCGFCNRILRLNLDSCSRCWVFVPSHNIYVRRPPPQQPIMYAPPMSGYMRSAMPPATPYAISPVLSSVMPSVMPSPTSSYSHYKPMPNHSSHLTPAYSSVRYRHHPYYRQS